MSLGDRVGTSLVDVQVNGYSRDCERDADERSLRAAIDAGYDPREAPHVFSALLQEDVEQTDEPYYLGNHPRVEERLDSYRRALGKWSPPPGAALRVGEETYQANVGPLMLENTRLDMKLGRWPQARATLHRYLKHRPQDAEGFLLLADIERDTGDESAARRDYRRAIEIDPRQAAAHRELGMLHRLDGDTAAATREFRRYLELAPEAVDRPIVEAYIEESAAAKQEAKP